MPAIKHNNIFSVTLLNSIYPLSKSLNSFLSQKMISSHYKKGDFIVKSGEVCDRIHIIRKGLVRGYFEYSGSEITTWVSVDSEIVTSISGFFKNAPSLEFIQCLEDTYTESLSFQDMDFAIKNYVEMARLNRILMETYYISAEYRSFLARIPAAKDRYTYFTKIYNPETIKRLPKKYLASLLNMRPETLSRLEKI
ncbi:Crp/Fnr family transcriptional regulator [Yeosuana marina]|uniref:Crp/Fnr family transcriptional regulator n=1 Tax=Yeosuana marina TaxID=1565536 RepID=UPI00141FF98F|nr:cyclic nucleotide-binding domain-containing protein [Yeosuana marina]